MGLGANGPVSAIAGEPNSDLHYPCLLAVDPQRITVDDAAFRVLVEHWRTLW